MTMKRMTVEFLFELFITFISQGHFFEQTFTNRPIRLAHLFRSIFPDRTKIIFGHHSQSNHKQWFPIGAKTLTFQCFL